MDVTVSSTLNEPGASGPGGATAPESISRLFEMTSDLLATISTDGRFVLLNAAWERLLGWTGEELLERPGEAFIPPDALGRGPPRMLAGPPRRAPPAAPQGPGSADDAAAQLAG